MEFTLHQRVHKRGIWMEYDKMTVAQLKDILRENDLPVSGKKSELIERLSSIPLENELQNEDITDNIDSQEESNLEESDSDEFFEEDNDDDFYDDFTGIHTARQKPILDDETKNLLKFRANQMKKQPAFRRQEWFRYKRLSHSGWRKPKGYQSKQRLNMKYRTPMARIGYGKISAVRGLHSSGFKEVLVHKIEDLESINPEKQAIRIGSSVGNRKRLSIHDRADDLGLRILNRRRIDRKGDLQ